MYIAHHLLTLGHQFRLRLAPILCDGTTTFVDLVPGFRRLGNDALNVGKHFDNAAYQTGIFVIYK